MIKMINKMSEKILSRTMDREGLDSCGHELYFDADSDGRNTYCRVTIVDPGGSYWEGLGFSRCNPKDKFNPEIGEAIAMSRAARAATAKIRQALMEES